MLFIPVLALICASLACAQDCIGASFSVKGRVVDQDGNPISNAQITAWNNGSFERPPFNVTATSDSKGYFETESVFSYGCTTFEVTISADNYQNYTTTYYPPAKEGWSPELPDEITITLNHND